MQSTVCIIFLQDICPDIYSVTSSGEQTGSACDPSIDIFGRTTTVVLVIVVIGHVPLRV